MAAALPSNYIFRGEDFPAELRLMDGVHATLEGRHNIWQKVLGAINFGSRGGTLQPPGINKIKLNGEEQN